MADSSTKRNRNLPQQLTLDHVSPATRLLEKRRQMFEVQEALDAQKEGARALHCMNGHCTSMCRFFFQLPVHRSPRDTRTVC